MLTSFSSALMKMFRAAASYLCAETLHVLHSEVFLPPIFSSMAPHFPQVRDVNVSQTNAGPGAVPVTKGAYLGIV